MSEAQNNSNRARLQQLLASIGSGQTETNADIPEEDVYNWNQPHCFNNEQLKKLDNFTKKLIATIGHKLSSMCQLDFKVGITSTSQLFIDELFYNHSEKHSDDYYLAFGRPGEFAYGAIGIPTGTALLLTTPMLGSDDTSENDSGKKLTDLERALLADIACSIVNVFSDSHDSFDFEASKNLEHGIIPLHLDGTEEMYKITFNIQKQDSDDSSEARILIPCRILDIIAEKNTYYENKFSKADISRSILESLQKVPVAVTGRLDYIQLTLEEAMSLQPGDILLLDRKIDEPIEAVVEGLTVLRGTPAKSAGKYAIAVTEFGQPAQGISDTTALT